MITWLCIWVTSIVTASPITLAVYKYRMAELAFRKEVFHAKQMEAMTRELNS